MSGSPSSILPETVVDDTKILQLYAHTALGRKLLPTAWVLQNGRCSCTMLEKTPSTKLCLQGSKVGKHPIIGQWDDRATDDWDEVRSWHAWSPHSNWGWLQDETFTLDIDPKRGGLDFLAQWEENTGGPSLTYRQRTRSGGWHFVYRQTDPPIPTCGDILPGIEIRASGTYIMLGGVSDGWTIIDPDQPVKTPDEYTLQFIVQHAQGKESGKTAPGAAGDTSMRLPDTAWFLENGFGGFSGSRNQDAYRLSWRLLALVDAPGSMITMQWAADTLKRCWLKTPQGSEPFDLDELWGALDSAWRRRERQKEELKWQQAAAESMVNQL